MVPAISAMRESDRKVMGKPTKEKTDEVAVETKSTRSRPALPAKSTVNTGAGPLARYDPLKQYLAEIANHEILDRETEHELGIHYRETGDVDAAKRLVTANLRLVVKIALGYRRYWMNLLDLIQEGNVGLMQAVKKFDPHKNVKLSSYASFWIKAYILKYVIDNWSLVKLGTTEAQRKLFFSLRKEQSKLELMGIDPTPKQIADKLNVKESEVIEMDKRMSNTEYSLDAPVNADSDDSHMDMLSDHQSIGVDDQLADHEIRYLFKQKLGEFRSNLNGREAFIFDNRMIAESPMTLQEIGDRYKISRERIRQIEERVLGQLKTFMQKELPDFADLKFAPGEG